MWKLAFTVGPTQKSRIRTIPAGSLGHVAHEVTLAKKRFSLPETTAVITCYEARRDGFWLHRFLVHTKIENIVVDSASVEVNRHKRRAKSDRLEGCAPQETRSFH
jgi:transposase